MNAAEQAKNFELTSKIAATVNLFKAEFPQIRVDLKPWLNDPDTKELVDPDSIDIGFHFPGISRSFQSRSILLQIRLYEDPVEGSRRAIGIEAAGYDHRGQRWQFSTIGDWDFRGDVHPQEAAIAQLKATCCKILEVFNSNAEASDSKAS